MLAFDNSYGKGDDMLKQASFNVSLLSAKGGDGPVDNASCVLVATLVTSKSSVSDACA